MTLLQTRATWKQHLDSRRPSAQWAWSAIQISLVIPIYSWTTQQISFPCRTCWDQPPALQLADPSRCSHWPWQNHSCLLSLGSGRAWLGSLCSSKYGTNTTQPHPRGRGNELQGPWLLGPLAHVNWYKRSVCVGVAPWIPPAMHQWSYSFFQCACFFLSDPCFGTIILEANSKFYVLVFQFSSLMATAENWQDML